MLLNMLSLMPTKTGRDDEDRVYSIFDTFAVTNPSYSSTFLRLIQMPTRNRILKALLLYSCVQLPLILQPGAV